MTYRRLLDYMISLDELAMHIDAYRAQAISKVEHVIGEKAYSLLARKQLSARRLGMDGLHT